MNLLTICWKLRSADKVMTRQMEEKLDAELMAVDLNHVICEYHSAIDKKRKPYV